MSQEVFCSAKHCRSTSKSPSVKFFPFPKILPFAWRKWKEMPDYMKDIPGWAPDDGARICSRHFRPEDIIGDDLKIGAIPVQSKRTQDADSRPCKKAKKSSMSRGDESSDAIDVDSDSDDEGALVIDQGESDDEDLDENVFEVSESDDGSSSMWKNFLEGSKAARPKKKPQPSTNGVGSRLNHGSCSSIDSIPGGRSANGTHRPSVNGLQSNMRNGKTHNQMTEGEDSDNSIPIPSSNNNRQKKCKKLDEEMTGLPSAYVKMKKLSVPKSVKENLKKSIQNVDCSANVITLDSEQDSPGGYENDSDSVSVVSLVKSRSASILSNHSALNSNTVHNVNEFKSIPITPMDMEDEEEEEDIAFEKEVKERMRFCSVGVKIKEEHYFKKDVRKTFVKMLDFKYGFVCDGCDERFPLKDALHYWKHIKDVCPVINQLYIFCPYKCGKRFKRVGEEQAYVDHCVYFCKDSVFSSKPSTDNINQAHQFDPLAETYADAPDDFVSQMLAVSVDGEEYIEPGLIPELEPEPEPEPEPEVHQFVKCPKCSSTLSLSEFEDHYLKYHLRFLCECCSERYYSENERLDHTIRDHATHFMFPLEAPRKPAPQRSKRSLPVVGQPRQVILRPMMQNPAMGQVDQTAFQPQVQTTGTMSITQEQLQNCKRIVYQQPDGTFVTAYLLSIGNGLSQVINVRPTSLQLERIQGNAVPNGPPQSPMPPGNLVPVPMSQLSRTTAVPQPPIHRPGISAATGAPGQIRLVRAPDVANAQRIRAPVTFPPVAGHTTELNNRVASTQIRASYSPLNRIAPRTKLVHPAPQRSMHTTLQYRNNISPGLPVQNSMLRSNGSHVSPHDNQPRRKVEESYEEVQDPLDLAEMDDPLTEGNGFEDAETDYASKRESFEDFGDDDDDIEEIPVDDPLAILGS